MPESENDVTYWRASLEGAPTNYSLHALIVEGAVDAFEAAPGRLAALVVGQDIQPIVGDGINGQAGHAVDGEHAARHTRVVGALVGNRVVRGRPAVVVAAVA